MRLKGRLLRNLLTNVPLSFSPPGESAEAEKNAALAKASTAAAAKVQAAAKAQAANKALASSKLHAEAAKKMLDDAAAKVLVSDQLLAEASARAIAGAEAAEKALAAAENKKGAVAAAPAAVSRATLDDVKTALTRLKDEVNAKAVMKVLRKFDATTALELSADKYAEVLTAIQAELE